MELMNALAKFEDGSEQGRAVRQEALQAIVLLLNPITRMPATPCGRYWATARRCWKTSRSRRPTAARWCAMR